VSERKNGQEKREERAKVEGRKGREIWDEKKKREGKRVDTHFQMRLPPRPLRRRVK
jgi:hypothetical protein